MQVKDSKVQAQVQQIPTPIKSIDIALDEYDDIFSDFDPSEYTQRILSDDFIKEIQKRHVETKKGEIEVRFSIPNNLRSNKIESLIKKRLKEYFQSQIKLAKKEINDLKSKGGKFFLLGFLILVFTIYLYEISIAPKIYEILTLLLTPIGWFGMWEGVSLLINTPKSLENQVRFFTQFSKAKYLFIDEEQIFKKLKIDDNQQKL